MSDIYRKAGFTMTMKKISGYTLIELMMTLSVAGIAMAVGIPKMADWIKPDLIKTAQREMHSGFVVARSQAIRMNGVACLCPSETASDPSPTCSASSQWETGWIAFSSSVGNCAYSASTDTLLKVWDGEKNGQGLFIRTDEIPINNVNYIRFNSRGQAQFLNGSAMKGVFTLSDDTGIEKTADGYAVNARGVDLHVTGRARMIRYADALSLP